MNDVELYDVIGAFDVLEHIQEDQLVLNNLFKATKSNGHLIITVPQHPSLWSSLDERSFHCRRYTRAKLIEKLNISGFEILYTTSFVFLLLPFMYISRKLYQNHKTDIISEFKISPTTNSILNLVMNLEILLLKLGIDLPFGGSLLVLAKKI
jgi:SAM-dependent methyltransferase